MNSHDPEDWQGLREVPWQVWVVMILILMGALAFVACD